MLIPDEALKLESDILTLNKPSHGAVKDLPRLSRVKNATLEESGCSSTNDCLGTVGWRIDCPMKRISASWRPLWREID
jgi:hypothetical protein